MTSLHIAASRGNLELTRVLLAEGFDFDLKEEVLGTPLEAALAWQHMDVVELLLLRGARVDKGLHTAAAHEDCDANLRLLEILVSHTKDIDQLDERNLTPLHLAIANKNHDAIRFLLAHGADCNIHMPPGRSPLMYACYCQDLAMVRTLLEYGADVNETTSTSFTPAITCMMEHENPDILQALIESGANINAALPGGHDPLKIAVDLGFKDNVSILLEAGADITRRDNSGNTIYHDAVRVDVEIMKRLLQYSDRNHEDGYGEVRKLEIDVRNEMGETPLHAAAACGNEAVASFLLDKGADINARDYYSFSTPLTEAILHVQDAMVPFLIGRGADISVVLEFRILEKTEEDGQVVRAIDHFVEENHSFRGRDIEDGYRVVHPNEIIIATSSTKAAKLLYQ